MADLVFSQIRNWRTLVVHAPGNTNYNAVALPALDPGVSLGTLMLAVVDSTGVAPGSQAQFLFNQTSAPSTQGFPLFASQTFITPIGLFNLYVKLGAAGDKMCVYEGIL